MQTVTHWADGSTTKVLQGQRRIWVPELCLPAAALSPVGTHLCCSMVPSPSPVDTQRTISKLLPMNPCSRNVATVGSPLGSPWDCSDQYLEPNECAREKVVSQDCGVIVQTSQGAWPPQPSSAGQEFQDLSSNMGRGRFTHLEVVWLSVTSTWRG